MRLVALTTTLILLPLFSACGGGSNSPGSSPLSPNKTVQPQTKPANATSPQKYIRIDELGTTESNPRSYQPTGIKMTLSGWLNDTQYAWSVSPSGSALMSDPSAKTPDFYFTEAGQYELRVTVVDGDLKLERSLSVSVEEGSDLLQSNLAGDRKKWRKQTFHFNGPQTNEMAVNPNPFTDYRYTLEMESPSGKTLLIPGYYDGDGKGGSAGNQWKAHFMPSETGVWKYTAHFQQGNHIAMDLFSSSQQSAGYFDQSSGEIFIGHNDNPSSDYEKYGQLVYADGFYLKYAEGPYWIKGGTNSPEDLLGYVGYDDTETHYRQTNHKDAALYDTTLTHHRSDWNSGDPNWTDKEGQDAKGIIGAINYLAEQNINSMYLLTMNIGGDAANVWPFAGEVDARGFEENDNFHYDVSKMRQWLKTFEHAESKDIFLHFVLGEAEERNKDELDGGALGPERKLFYREMVARFGHIKGLQWNVYEEYDLSSNNHAATAEQEVINLGTYLGDIDAYKHPVTVLNTRSVGNAWDHFMNKKYFDVTSLQFFTQVYGIGDEVIPFRERLTASGKPIPVHVDEPGWLEKISANDARKYMIWDVYLSGAAGLEWYNYCHDRYFDTPAPTRNGCKQGTYRNYYESSEYFKYTWYARKFLKENVPFWEMTPAQSLYVSGGAPTFTVPQSENNRGDRINPNRVFAKVGEVYVAYMPSVTNNLSLNFGSHAGTYQLRWYNPRNGQFVGNAQLLEVTGGATEVGAPPSDAHLDWVALVEKQ